MCFGEELQVASIQNSRNIILFAVVLNGENGDIWTYLTD